MTLFVFGGRSTALEVAELARMLNPERPVVHVVGDDEEPVGEGGIRFRDLDAVVRKLDGPACAIITMADHSLRALKEAALEAIGLEPLTLVHPQATVSPSAQLGPGCYIAAGARVSTGAKLGPHSMVNLNATIGHDTKAGAHLVVHPGAAIGGNVRMGKRVLVGANAFIGQGLRIGDDVQIDAMAQVTRDLPPRHLATSRTLRILPRVDMEREAADHPWSV
jgi:sugar O-acyltransferase (sialic acid O-acetyltransferase NeuD family)